MSKWLLSIPMRILMRILLPNINWVFDKSLQMRLYVEIMTTNIHNATTKIPNWRLLPITVKLSNSRTHIIKTEEYGTSKISSKNKFLFIAIHNCLYKHSVFSGSVSIYFWFFYFETYIILSICFWCSDDLWQHQRGHLAFTIVHFQRQPFSGMYSLKYNRGLHSHPDIRYI